MSQSHFLQQLGICQSQHHLIGSYLFCSHCAWQQRCKDDFVSCAVWLTSTTWVEHKQLHSIYWCESIPCSSETIIVSQQSRGRFQQLPPPSRLTVCAGCNHACQCWGSSLLMITSCLTSYYCSYVGLYRGTAVSWSLPCTRLDHRGWMDWHKLVMQTGYHNTESACI